MQCVYNRLLYCVQCFLSQSILRAVLLGIFSVMPAMFSSILRLCMSYRMQFWYCAKPYGRQHSFIARVTARNFFCNGSYVPWHGHTYMCLAILHAIFVITTAIIACFMVMVFETWRHYNSTTIIFFCLVQYFAPLYHPYRPGIHSCTDYASN